MTVFALLLAGVLGNDHWGGWGKFGYKVKVHHPSIHGWHVGPSHGWTSFYDSHDKNPKGWGHDDGHGHGHGHGHDDHKKSHHKGWGWGH